MLLVFCPILPLVIYAIAAVTGRDYSALALLFFRWIPLSCIIVIGAFVLWRMRTRLTYFRLDTMAAFQEAVHRLLVKQVNKTIEGAGRKPLSADESKPVLHKLLQR